LYIKPRFVIEDDDLDLLWRFTTYVSKVVHYARLEYLRKQEHRFTETALDLLPPKMLSYKDSYFSQKDAFVFEDDVLTNAFNGLSSLRKEILICVFSEGLSAQETADRLGCPVEHIYLHKHRALRKLRDQIMEGGDQNGK